MQKKPPSRLKYEKQHPVIAIRLSKELKEILDEIKNGSEDLSYADLIKSGLKNVAVEYKKAFSGGYEKARQDWQITYPCYICGGEVVVSPGSEDHKALIKALKNEEWSHQACIRQAEGF